MEFITRRGNPPEEVRKENKRIPTQRKTGPAAPFRRRVCVPPEALYFLVVRGANSSVHSFSKSLLAADVFAGAQLEDTPLNTPEMIWFSFTKNKTQEAPSPATCARLSQELEFKRRENFGFRDPFQTFLVSNSTSLP